MTVARNLRRRTAFIDAAQTALKAITNRGDQHQTFEVLVGPISPESLASGVSYHAIGYQDLLTQLVRDAALLDRGQTITIKLPSTKEQRAVRREYRERLGLEGSEFLDPKLVNP